MRRDAQARRRDAVVQAAAPVLGWRTDIPTNFSVQSSCAIGKRILQALACFRQTGDKMNEARHGHGLVRHEKQVERWDWREVARRKWVGVEGGERSRVTLSLSLCRSHSLALSLTITRERERERERERACAQPPPPCLRPAKESLKATIEQARARPLEAWGGAGRGSRPEAAVASTVTGPADAQATKGGAGAWEHVGGGRRGGARALGSLMRATTLRTRSPPPHLSTEGDRQGDHRRVPQAGPEASAHDASRPPGRARTWLLQGGHCYPVTSPLSLTLALFVQVHVGRWLYSKR